MGSAAAAVAAAAGGGGLSARLDQQRPASATGLRPITPSFANEKENGQNFVDFNPAGEKILQTLWRKLCRITVDQTHLLMFCFT